MHAVIDSSDNRFSRYWEQLVAADPSHNPLYAPGRDAGQADTGFQDHSFMVLAESEPVIGCSLTSSTDSRGRRRLGFLGREASTLVNRRQLRTPSNNLQPEAVRLLQEHFSRLLAEMSPDYLDYLDPVSCGLMSPLTQVLLERGARPEVHQAQVIRLALSNSALLRSLQPDYQQPLKAEQPAVSLSVISGTAVDKLPSTLEQRRTQYFNALGSAAECWSSCLALIRRNRGFVVQARAAGGEYTSALFLHNGHTSHYVLHDGPHTQTSRPILLRMLWHGLKYSKAQGCAFLDLGGWGLPEVGINPAGFGGTSHTRLKVSLQPR